MEIGMATAKLAAEASRLIDWLTKFKPEQRYITFPNSFGGHDVQKILPRMAKQRSDGSWSYLEFEIRFPPLANVIIKHRDIKPRTDGKGENIAHMIARNVPLD